MPAPLWRPSPAQLQESQLTRFREVAERESGRALPDYAALHAWSVRDRAAFWRLVWQFCGVIGEAGDRVVAGDPEAMPGARWFPDARLNFAENLLRQDGDASALVFRSENGDTRRVSHRSLRSQVASFAAFLRAEGVAPGDRIAAVLPNLPETVAGALAAASIGAIWTSCSPDFGAQGVLDRFGQVEPKLLLTTDAYRYNGKAHDVGHKSLEIRRALPSVDCWVGVPYAGAGAWPDEVVPFSEALGAHAEAPLAFEPLPFDHPLYLLYSSGTTGAPKCILHGAGGTLLQHLKEHRLHTDLRAGDKLFYFTTCGWMMWNWLVSGLAAEATLCLFDGAPTHPDVGTLFRYAQEEQIDVFGTSAKFLDAVAKTDCIPKREFDLSSVRTVLSTGSPLVQEGFDFFYEKVAPHAQLASISGGTDIVSCFVLGNPTAPVWRGEIQAKGLGMAVEVMDDAGRPVEQQKGELVCTAPFPSMPLGFWNDPSGERYHAAYFERFPGIWCHGDFAEITEHGGVFIHGRSDAVLNPGGVRIGTAEIYRQVERESEVLESLVVGQEWEGDTRIVLFVVLRPDATLDDALRDRIRAGVRRNATPRHVPARIVQVQDIPRTRSGKIVELAVREVVHGRPVKNREALANPEALVQFADREELAS
jgi:acetoacetyl-CoA synthetase